jgi:hypothetical protein
MGVHGGAMIPILMRRFKHPDGEGRIAERPGGVAEWLRQGPAKPRTAVRFRPPPPSPDLSYLPKAAWAGTRLAAPAYAQ